MATGLKVALVCRTAYGIEEAPDKHLYCTFFKQRGILKSSIGKYPDRRCLYSVSCGGGVNPEIFLCTCEEARYEYEKYEKESE